MDALGDATQPLGADVLDVRVPRLDRLDLARIDVHRDDLAALLGERHRERQTDIAESDDADAVLMRRSV